MATKEHSALTDADGIHEPKGFDSATAQQLIRVNAAGTDVEWVAQDVALTGAAGVDKQILVADGAGGVAWQEYPYGGLTYENRTTPIQITGSGGTSDVKVSDVLTTECAETNSSSEFTILTTGELKYTGTLSRHFHVVCQASSDLASAATNDVAFSIYKYDDSGASWARVVGSDAISTIDSSNIRFAATHCDVMLDTNDKLVLALQNISGTPDVRLYTYYLFAMGMPGT